MSEYTRIRAQGSVNSEWIRSSFTSPTYSSNENEHFALMGNVSGGTKSIKDNPHSNFRQRVKAGEVIMGDMAIVETSYETTQATFSYCPNPEWGVSKLEGPLASWCGAVSPIQFYDRIPSLRNNVINAAFAKMNGSPLMAGEFASDYKSTLTMLRSPFKGAFELAASILKSKRRRMELKRTLTGAKAFADAWLEYRYGWKPLVMDCDTAIKEAQKLRKRHEKVRLVARAGGSLSHKESVPFSMTGLGDWTTLSSYGTTSCSGECSVNAGVLYEVTTPRSTAERVVTSLGLLPSDVPSTLWEIVPFSFVVDWFSGVGSWIRANVPNPYVTVLGSWVTEVKTWETHSFPEFYRAPMFWRDVWYPAVKQTVGSHSERVHEVARDCGVLPSAIPPSKGINLSVVQLTDALSLSCSNVVKSLIKLKH